MPRMDVLFYLGCCTKARLTPGICAQLNLLLLKVVTARIAACPIQKLDSRGDTYFRIKKYMMLASLLSKELKHY